MENLPIIIVDVAAIPDRLTGGIVEAHIHYRFDQNIEGVRDILPAQEQLIFKIDELPERKRDAVLLLGETLKARVKPPSTNLFGRDVSALTVFHHFVYQIESAETKYYLRCGGRFQWPGGAEGDFQPNFQKDEVSASQQMMLDQILPWAREHALRHAQTKVNEVFASIGDPPTVYQSKKLVMISYRSTEGSEFSQTLWNLLGETGLFTPKIDSYDLIAGDWKSQLEDWIDSCDVFIAVYTPDYENGPVSKLELVRALARLKQGSLTFVPVLLSSTPSIQEASDQNGSDFRDTDLSENVGDTEAFKRLVALLGNINRNQFDSESE